MKKAWKKHPLSVSLMILLGVLILIGLTKLIWDFYWECKEYTIEDINGIWVHDMKEGGHSVMYIHDGWVDYVWYTEDDESSTGFDFFYSMKMKTLPEGSFNTFSWWGIVDNERTELQSWTGDTEFKNAYEFEFRRNKIYRKVIGGEAEYVRGTAEENPHIVKMVNKIEKSYELSENGLPLEVNEVRCLNRVGVTQDTYDSFLYITVTNPNPFRIDGAYATLRWEGYQKNHQRSLDSIPANSTVTYVLNVSFRDILGLGQTIDPTECTLNYNRYCVTTGENETPLVEITDSRVIREEPSGLVKEIEVDTKALDLSENKWPNYDLFAIFYLQDEMVGVATGLGSMETIDQPDVMSYVSEIRDYDHYDIVVVNKYKTPLHDR